jgi:hypothetical protein
MQESDTDLEVVLEKKGNTDEACIDQVQLAPAPPSLPVMPLGTLTICQAMRFLSSWHQGILKLLGRD